MKQIIFHIILVFYWLQATAGGEVYPVGARSAGMCRSSVAIGGIWSIMNNQAGIALLSGPEISFAYENKFLLKETGNSSMAFAYPTDFGVLGISFNYFGFSKYNEIRTGLAYARAFGEYIRIGLQLDYLRTTVTEGYGTHDNVTFEVGVQSDVTRNITLGAYVFNPIRVKLADYTDEHIPAIFRFGISWHFSPQFFVTAEAEKNSFYSGIILRGGLEYTFKEKFILRTGVGSKQDIFSMGFGFKLKGFKLEIAATMHQVLGFSPQTTLSYSF